MPSVLGKITLQRLDFLVVPAGSWWALKGPAVYVLGRYNILGPHVDFLYIGKSGELQGYIGPNHHKWHRAAELGMDVVAFHPIHQESHRSSLETVLIHQYQPPLNEQLIRRNALADVLQQPPY
jgi:hypothetical protein